MFWYIVLGVSIVLFIVSVIITIVKRRDEDICFLWSLISAIALILAFTIGTLSVALPMKYKREITTFIETKRYIEEVGPTLSQTDNYAITNSRIEMNKWLYEIQFRYKNYHFWNFIPAEVMELEEIK